MSPEASRSTVRLSVVLPAKNAAPWLEETLDSVLRQAVDALEVIVLDNGSTDGTADIALMIAARDERVRVIDSPARSAAEARNEGVGLATGDYLVFVDSDDLVPDGAYAALLSSLEISGSDMAVGDHLKFSPTETWSPTLRWYEFDEHQMSRRPSELPGLLGGRACWNRMFRRSFWDRSGLGFPPLDSLEDMEPMTRAMVESRSIDVVPQVVYLYRDRGDGSSVSKASDAAATVRYLQQERACAELVQCDEVLRRQHALVVLDADGWVHMSRFLASSPDVEARASVETALASLLEHVSLDPLPEVAPNRRMLWALLLAGKAEAAETFVSETTAGDPVRSARAWAEALAVLRVVDDRMHVLPSLVNDGLLPALVNGADGMDLAVLEALLRVLRDLEGVEQAEGLRRAMQNAVLAGDAPRVAAVSGLRHVVPLIVSGAASTPQGLELTGCFPADDAGKLRLVLRSENEVRDVEVIMQERRWRASVDATLLMPGRWTVAVRAEVSDELFPVITARMPLPPVDERFPLQPLADRRNGWRFLIEHRAPERRGVARLASRVRNRLGRLGGS